VRRRAAAISLALGLGLIALARYAAPLGSPPLYDGVVVQEPYRYLTPGPGQVGSPTSYHASIPVSGTTSPEFVAATTENPPQAQLVAQSGGFVVPAGVTSVTVTIEPVSAAAAPAGNEVAGNGYRISVTDPSGTQLTIGQTAPPTLLLRAPDGVSSGTIERLDAGTWQPLTTYQGGQPGIVLTNVTELGEFAVIAPVAGPLGLDVRLIVLLALVPLVVVVGLVAVAYRRRLRPPRAPEAVPSRPRRSSKRRRGGSRRGGSR
jgi:hypothetical protein